MSKIINLIKKIESLRKENPVQNSSKERIFFSKHILEDILTLQYFKENRNSKIEYLVLYNLSIHLLNNVRKENENLGKYYCQKLMNIFDSLSNNLMRKYFSILYYPAIAYYSYVYGDIKIAIDNLNKGINLIINDETLFQDNEFKSVICEQTLNKYKCYVKMNIFDMGFKESLYLLKFINDEFSGIEDYKIKFEYYLEELYKKIKNNDDNIFTFINSIKPELHRFLNKGYYSTNLFLTDNIDEKLLIIIDEIESIINLPKIMQQIIFKYFSFDLSFEDKILFEQELSIELV